MSKMGVYGLLRFALPLFPDAAHWFQPLLLSLAVIGILYCALVATGQRDFKRLVAYSSVSHLGFIVLGIFAFTVQGLQGGVFYMVAHGLVIGGLFFVTGMLQERRGTSDIAAFGGLQRVAPRMAGAMLVITLGDLDGREWAIVVPLLAAIIALGIFPRPLLQRIEPAARQVAQITAQAAAGQRAGSALGADRLDRSPTNPTVTARGAGPGPDGGTRAPAGPAGPDR
jgi:NADH:ubiquinone oxidoreductase subunit 4 (subunit M)